MSIEEVKQKVLIDVAEKCDGDRQFFWSVVESFVSKWSNDELIEWYEQAYDVSYDEDEDEEVQS